MIMATFALFCMSVFALTTKTISKTVLSNYQCVYLFCFRFESLIKTNIILF